MKIKQIFSFLWKNILVFIVGGVIGIAVSMFYLFQFWFPANGGKVGLGIIAIIPIMLILFAIMGLVIGGIFGIIIYQIIRFIKKKN